MSDRRTAASAWRSSGSTPRVPLAGTGVSMIADDAVRYARLEAGALYLAAQARCLSERREHLGMAELYARRRAQAITWGSN